MKRLHLTRRTPQKNGGFSWGRFPVSEGGPVNYRLFRRDHRGVLHMWQRTFRADESRGDIAPILRRARHSLRDRVDEIDLAAIYAREAA